MGLEDFRAASEALGKLHAIGMQHDDIPRNKLSQRPGMLFLWILLRQGGIHALRMKSMCWERRRMSPYDMGVYSIKKYFLRLHRTADYMHLTVSGGCRWQRRNAPKSYKFFSHYEFHWKTQGK